MIDLTEILSINALLTQVFLINALLDDAIYFSPFFKIIANGKQAKRFGLSEVSGKETLFQVTLHFYICAEYLGRYIHYT